MARGFLFLLCFFVASLIGGSLIGGSKAFANQTMIGSESLLSLSSNPIWRNLLHLPDGVDQVTDSTVISPEFFLSNGTAHTELIATVAAFNGEPHLPQQGTAQQGTPQRISQQEDAQELVCRFPARFLWLKQQVVLPDALSITRCQSFKDWTDLEQLESVSLGYVGSYLGNPASSFGHVLVRMHSRGGGPDKRSLLDPAVNFGAAVPPGEGSIPYVIKGLLGSYTAGFGSQEYYLHDLVYGHAEQRDIWEYELNLERSQMIFLVAHLWELQNKEFRYYFLLQNCAYRIAEVLAVLTGETLIPKGLLWYAPEKLFHKLKETTNSDGAPLIKTVRFVPSLQRALYSDFKKLPVSDQQVANHVATALFDNTEIDLSSVKELGTDRQIAVLDFLIDYSTYRLIEGENVTKILAARFGFAQKTEALVATPVLPPSSGTPASLVRLSRIWRNGERPVTRLSGSPFHYDKLGRHANLGAELVFLNFAADIDTNSKIALADSTIMRIRKSIGSTPDIANETRLSWSIDSGFRRGVRCSDCSGFYARGGAGLAADLLPGFQVSSFVNTDIDLHNLDINISAELGVLAALGKSTFALELEQKLGRDTEWDHRYEAQYRYKLKSNMELRTGFQDRFAERFSASVSYYF